MNVIDYIPKGRENAVTRAELCSIKKKNRKPFNRKIRTRICISMGKP